MDSGERSDAGASSAQEHADRRVGERVGGAWQLDGVLGIGGMATVFAATGLRGERAAVKIMHAELVPMAPLRDRFLREGEASRQVDHPGCVSILGEGTTERGEPFLAMELLDGETLEARCLERGGRIPVLDALAIARSVLATLEVMHDKGVIHRDVKPANVFLTRDGRVKLLDLGVAQLRDPAHDVTRPGVAMGTPAYMSPEQAMGRRHLVDGRSDLYALGATLHLVLSGTRLHAGLSDDEALVRAATQPASSVARVADDLPVGVVALVDRALQWDRRNRFQSARQMLEVVERLMAELGDPREPAPDARAGGAQGEVPSDPWADVEISRPAGGLPHRPRSPQEPDARSEPDRTAATVGTTEQAGRPAGHGFAQLELGAAPVEVGVVASNDHSMLDVGLELESLPPPRPTTTIEVDPYPSPLPARPPPVRPSPEFDSRLEDAAEAPRGAMPSSLQELFVRIDRLLVSARQYGPAHPETQGRIGPLYDAMVSALGSEGGEVGWRVLPFCFMHEELVAWEPQPPSDLVPYVLSVAGLRSVRIKTGVTEEEIRDLFGAMMIDANTDPADVASSLWEAPFTHVECVLEEDLPGEEAHTVGEDEADAKLQQELLHALGAAPSAAERLARGLSRGELVEAAAMAEGFDVARADSSRALVLDSEIAGALASELGTLGQQIEERHVEVVLAGWADALRRGDAAEIATALASFARRSIRTGRHEDLFHTHATMLGRVEGAAADDASPVRMPSSEMVTAALFPADVLEHVVRMVSEWSHLLTEDQVLLARECIDRLFGTLGPEALRACLELVCRTPAAAVPPLLTYVVRMASGQDAVVFEALPALPVAVAERLVAELARRWGPNARHKLAPLLGSPSAVVRCLALAEIAPPDALGAELTRLFSADSAEARRAALGTFVRRRVTSAGPALVRLVQNPSFPERTGDEQRLMLESLWAVHSSRAETLLASLASRHGLIPDPVFDETRMLALRLLGERASSQHALDASRAAARLRPWNTAQVRAVAEQAARDIEQRAEACRGQGGADG